MDQDTKIQKGVKIHTIAVGVDARSEACMETTSLNGFIITGGKVYRPQLTYTYKET